MRQLIQLFGKIIEPTAKRFYQTLNYPQLTQKFVQREICDRLIKSEYGKSLNIQSVADWQRIPIVDYDKLKPWILEKENERRRRIPLTPEPILFYEKTSGSTGAIKWIPYTRSLRKSFNQMFCIWAYDLIQNGPNFSTGKLYACISPQLNLPDFQPENTLSLQNDLDYLDSWLRWVLHPWLVMPKNLKHLDNPDSFKYQLSLALLQAEDLEIISIWSPSFLQINLKYIQDNQTLFQKDLQNKISYKRLKILSEPQINWQELWSNLKLISCWDAVNAADGAKDLRSQFPQVLVQGKGLLATEAPMTIPLIEANGYVPLIDEVFFEFENDRGEIYNLDELSINQEYTIILSQKGGLYRYRIGDRIRVTSIYRQTPCLEFLGRDQAISDLVGEKLQENFVCHSLADLNLPETSFKTLIPVTNPPHYVLLLDRAKETPETLVKNLDIALSKSPQYQRARLLTQLALPEVLISPQIPELLALDGVRSGKIWGSIKYPILTTKPMTDEFLARLKFQLQSNS